MLVNLETGSIHSFQAVAMWIFATRAPCVKNSLVPKNWSYTNNYLTALCVRYFWSPTAKFRLSEIFLSFPAYDAYVEAPPHRYVGDRIYKGYRRLQLEMLCIRQKSNPENFSVRTWKHKHFGTLNSSNDICRRISDHLSHIFLTPVLILLIVSRLLSLFTFYIFDLCSSHVKP